MKIPIEKKQSKEFLYPLYEFDIVTYIKINNNCFYKTIIVKTKHIYNYM